MLLHAHQVGLVYGPTTALSSATATIESSEVVAIVGPSGSGKSSLLYCMAGLTKPSSGVVEIDGQDVAALSSDDVAALRRRRFGFVFQSAELVPELTIAENIELPLNLLGRSSRDARARVGEMLELLGIAATARRRPDQVSGGQAQRAAVARALIHGPSIVFADEPTGALDSANSDIVLDALVSLARRSGSAVVIVTHDDKVAAAADRRIEMRDGRCVDDLMQ